MGLLASCKKTFPFSKVLELAGIVWPSNLTGSPYGLASKNESRRNILTLRTGQGEREVLRARGHYIVTYLDRIVGSNEVQNQFDSRGRIADLIHALLGIMILESDICAKALEQFEGFGRAHRNRSHPGQFGPLNGHHTAYGASSVDQDCPSSLPWSSRLRQPHKVIEAHKTVYRAMPSAALCASETRPPSSSSLTSMSPLERVYSAWQLVLGIAGPLGKLAPATRSPCLSLV